MAQDRDRFGGVSVDQFGGVSVTEEDYAVTAPPTMATPETFRQQGFDPTAGMNPWAAFRSKFVEGVRTVGRAMNLPGGGYDEPDAYQQYQSQAIQERFPKSSMTGEIVGEAAPFAIAGGPIGGVASTPVRVGLSGLLGAVEGWLISKGHGGDTNQNVRTSAITATAAGVMEAVLPIVGRHAGALYRRVRGRAPRGSLFTPDGMPTDELKKVLQDSGVSLDDLTDQAMAVLRDQPGVDPAQAARKGRFEALGVPATQGDISQEFGQQAMEGRLAQITSSNAAEPLRQLRLDQSEAFMAGINDMVDNLGVPDEVGPQIKSALLGRLDNLTGQKNVLYKSMAENSPHVMSMPLFTDNILEAMPDAAEIRRLTSLTGNNVGALQDLMVEFGIDQSQDAVEAFTKSGGVVTPLNLGNLEDFRSFLNRLPDGMTPGGRATGHWVSQVKGALDAEFDMIDDVLQRANVTDTSLAEPLREARALVRQIKTEYSPQSIVGRLTRVKPDNFTPVVEASDIYKNIVGPSKPVEILERTVDSLAQAPNGQAALGHLQSATVLNAMERALKAPSSKIHGEQLFTYSQFYRELDRIGDDKLKLIFKNNDAGLNRLMMFKEAARDLTPNSAAMPKGSAAVNLDIANNILQRAGNLQGVTQVMAVLRWVVNAGSDRRAVFQAMQARPAIKKQLTTLQREFPAIASAFGIAAYINMNEEGQQ